MTSQTYWIGGKSFTLFSFDGTVLSATASHETVYSQQYSVLARSAYLHSQHVESTSFFFVDATGQQRFVELDRTFPVMQGQEVTVVYAAVGGQSEGLPMGVLNKTIGHVTTVSARRFNDRYQAIRTRWINARLGAGCLAPIVMAALLFYFGIVLNRPLYLKLFACGFVLAMAYMFFEGWVGVRLWGARAHRKLDQQLGGTVASYLADSNGRR